MCNKRTEGCSGGGGDPEKRAGRDQMPGPQRTAFYAFFFLPADFLCGLVLQASRS
jgi:hypothetical protein